MASEEHYWRDVLKRAWASTLDSVGWDTKKVLSAIFVALGSIVITGITNGFTTISTIISLVIGAALLAPLLFIWGVIQAQADMYRDLAKQPSKPAVAAAPETNYLADPKPDYEMWRHRENLTLLEAAQLWAGVRPSVAWGTRGRVNDTFAMLCGAIQKGDLKFIPKEPVYNPSAADTVRQMEQKSPTTDTKVTRDGLKAFANKYGYDPEFLRDPAPVATPQSPATGQ